MTDKHLAYVLLKKKKKHLAVALREGVKFLEDQCGGLRSIVPLPKCFLYPGALMKVGAVQRPQVGQIWSTVEKRRD